MATTESGGGQDVEPFDAIRAFEQDLRSLIETTMSGRFGPDWLEQSGLTAARVEELGTRQTEESRKRPGVRVDTRPIRYAQFFELAVVIRKNWEFFREVLGARKTFDVYFDRLDSYRNAPAHSRDLLPFERNLVLGMTGEIRNRITIYRSEVAPNKEYYPRIESVVDSVGREYKPEEWYGPPRSPLTVVVGQELEFLCRGWDPQGRAMNWTLLHPLSYGDPFDTAVGEQVRLKMTMPESLVGEDVQISVVLTGSGKYHRIHGSWDDNADYYFHVVPPADDGGEAATSVE